MITATNTAHLEPLTDTRPSIATGWGKGTVYVGEDYLTDGTSLVEASLLSPADRHKLAQRYGSGWPANRPLPSHKQVSAVVDAALSAERTPVELLGCAGGQAFLRIAPNHDVLVPTARLAYLIFLTGADRITATPHRQRGSNTYVLWTGEHFAGLLAVV